jgi:hypothetical protein
MGGSGSIDVRGVQYFWQGNHQIYGQLRCMFTVLANPTCAWISDLCLHICSFIEHRKSMCTHGCGCALYMANVSNCAIIPGQGSITTPLILDGTPACGWGE